MPAPLRLVPSALPYSNKLNPLSTITQEISCNAQRVQHIMKDMKTTFTSASCPTCNTLFERLPMEYNEDTGYAILEVHPCGTNHAHRTTTTRLARLGHPQPQARTPGLDSRPEGTAARRTPQSLDPDAPVRCLRDRRPERSCSHRGGRRHEHEGIRLLVRPFVLRLPHASPGCVPPHRQASG